MLYFIQSVLTVFCFISFSCSEPIVFKQYWGGDTFEGAVNITAKQDYVKQHQLILLFNKPVTSLTVCIVYTDCMYCVH